MLKALKGSITHLIYGSVCGVSENAPDVLQVKFKLQKHFRTCSGVKWSIVQSVFFMESLILGEHEHALLEHHWHMFRTKSSQYPFPMISMYDFAKIVLSIFADPDQYISQISCFVAEEKTFGKAASDYRQMLGQFPRFSAPTAAAKVWKDIYNFLPSTR
jgi:hypothetical protein